MQIQTKVMSHRLPSIWGRKVNTFNVIVIDQGQKYENIEKTHIFDLEKYYIARG